METVKQYLPWIIGAIVIIYIARKLTTKTSLVPQTQLIQTPQSDAYTEARSQAFQSLIGLAGITTQTEAATNLETLRINAEQSINLAGINASERIANLNAFQREQDRQVQQTAIDRYYSSRNTGQIVNSISQALSSIFANRGGGNIFGTPPTFPSFGGF